MNKNLFRIIFNERRGQLMAVSETATAVGKAASGEGAVTGNGRKAGILGTMIATLRPLYVSVLASLGIMMVVSGSAGAQVIADPNAPGNQRPTVLQTTNGLPQINIQTPSAAGVSRNTYRQFDIQSNGAILNNARTNAQTQIGGWVQGNPWLATGSARVILNEVNSANPSQLRGYIEVAGQRAEVIIANPAGVNADGAGFINASRVTITTGTPQINGGNLEGYLVQRGTVTINGKGLDATLTDYTGILARAVQINAGIWAKDLKIVTGANQINAEHTTHTTTAGAGAAPTFALDVAQLGGMYAGKITLIGTESGVGVRNAGVIGATAGDVVLQSDGWLTNSGSIQASAAGNTQISTVGDITNSGTIYATGNTSVKARGNISISGLVAAQNHTTVLGNGATSRIDATSGAVLASGLNTDGTLRTTGDLQVQAPSSVALHGKTASAGNTNIAGSQLDLSGANVSGSQLMFTATNGDLNAAHAIVTAQGIVTAQTPQMLRTDGAQVTANQINMSAHDLSNIGGQITQSGASDLAIQLPGNLNNSQGRIATNSKNFMLGANTLTNTDGTIEHAGTGSLNIGATTFDGQRGITTSNGALSLNATTVNMDSATTTANQVTINADTLSNRSGHISQTGARQTTLVASQRLDNTAGKIETNGNATISTATLVNSQGRIASADSVEVTANASADNTDGTITAAQNIALTGGNLNNTRGAIQAVGGDATIKVADLSNNAGNVYADSNLNTSATDVTNSGNLYSAGNQILNVTGTINNTGAIAAQGANTISANSLISGATSLLGAGIKADGTLSTAGNLNITTTQGLTANGQNLAAGNAMLTGAWVNVSSSQTSATSIAVTATDGNVTTDHATVTAPGTLSITAIAQNTQTLSNTQGVLSAGQLNAHVANLNNVQGSIVQTGTGNTAIQLTSPSSTFDNSAGRIATHGQNLTIDANTFTNTDGKIEHAGMGTLAITAATLNDQRGQITGNGTLNIAVGNIDHRSASTIAQQVTITATNLDNRQGEITQLGAGPTTIAVSQNLDNRAGAIASNGNTDISAQALTNQGGYLRASGTSNLNITTTATLDNSGAGHITAGGNAILVTDAIVNQQGEITAGGTLIATVTQGVQNTQGLIAAAGNATLTAATLDNTLGTLASVQGNLNVATVGSTNNDSGKLQADGDVTLTNSRLTNTQAAGQTTAGSITGRNIVIDTRSQALNNQFGTVVASQSANLQTGILNNNAGLIQAGTALIVNTHGQILTNTNASGYTARNPGIPGGIASSGTATIDSGALNNASGFIGAIGAISGTTGQIDNTAGGQIVGQSSLNLTIAGLNNQGGQIQMQGDVTLNAGGGAIDNRYSLIRSNAAVSLTAATIDNRNTLGSNQGIEGNDVALNTTAVNNAFGAIRADNDLTVTNANSVINTQGLMSAGNTLSIQDQAASRTLAITNTNGTLIAGQYNTLRAASLTGDGRVLSKQDLKVDLTSSYTNGAAGEITANRDAIITTTGNLTNSSKLQAGGKLTINANNIDNTVTGDINAGTTQVTATNVLTNRGVIDGINTEINATTLNNVGTGRIYGDNLSIAATTVNNNPEGGTAATIAARDRLYIGAQTLNNGEHALIFSGGDMAIGGSLDTNRDAVGQAGMVNNASATIEALGSLSLSAALVNNLNNHFSTQIVPIGAPENITEYQGSGSPNRYRAGTPGVYIHNDESDQLQTPEANYETWTKYEVTRTVRQSVIAASDPGRIIAGSNLTITANTVLNDDSHIIAGAVLNINAASLQNPQTLGQRITSDLGAATSYWRDHQKGGDTTGSSVAAYAAPDTIQTTSLNASRQDSYTAPAGSGTTLAGAVTPTVSGNTSAAGAASANVNPSAIVNVLANVNGVNAVTGIGASTVVATNGPNQAHVNPITQVSLASPSGSAQIVRTTTPPTQIPNTSLFAINPAPTAGYWIETDPRFTNYRQWVSSDYMLGQIQLDPAVTQKRLGDGFYEQRLIREQVAQLTGQRFLGDYRSDDAQYRALMDAGLTYANASNLRPGIALSAAQMAALTSDIVWLVEQEVTLADGSKQRAWAPQVYVRVRDGDVDGNGSLLAGKDVNINLSGDLTNVGAIAGRSIVNITADNVQNLGGRINGEAVSVAAQTDLNNIGGAISANSQLRATAGRDIKIETTTRSASSSVGGNSFSRVTIDRVAGLYVSGEARGSTLVASAGRDVNIIAGVIGHGGTDGATFISATRNLNLGTITSAASNNLKWDDKNRRSDSESTEIGSQIQGVGRIDFAAGQDINVRAATVQAGGTLTAVAGNDINVIAGQSTQSVDEAHQHTSKGLLSSKTITTRDSMNGTSAIGSTLEGQHVLLSSGQDVNIQGAAVNAEKALIVDAKRDVNITAAEDHHGETHFSQTQRQATGFAKGLATMIAIVDPIAALTPNSVNQVAIAALLTKQNQTADQDNTGATAVGSQLTGGTINVESGRDALVKGSALVADGDVNVVAGRNLTVTTAENTQAGQFTATEKTIGLLRFDATGNSVGKREQDQAQQNTATSHSASQIVSLGQGGESGNEGSVRLIASGNNTITGSSVLAPAGDINISGASVLIDDAQNSATQASQTHAKETAATAQVKSGYVEAIKGAYEAVQTARAAKQDTGSDRMAGLAAINAAISVYNAYTGIQGSATAASQNAAPISAISVSSSIGVSKSESDSSSNQSTAQGSQLAAGGDLNITANGDVANGSGNVTMIGANLTAGQSANLSATGHIDLLAAENTTQVHSTNSSSNASLGVTFALGGAQNGFSFQIGAQGARGLVNGEETTYSNTQIRVGSADTPGTLTIKSGGDITLRGASASADHIQTEVGGNLVIESLKDKIKYDSQQTSVGGGVSICVPPICYGQMVAVTINAAESKIKADHDSVGANDEAAQRGQSGLKAGDGGFDVKVAGNTTLIGGVITSTEQAVNENNNSFQTGGALATQDIQNQSELDAYSVSANISTGSGSTGGSFGYGEVSDSQSSVTKAAISGIAGNVDARTGDAEAGIKPVFTEADAEKVNKSLSVQTGITNDFGKNAAKIVGDIAASKMKPIVDANNYQTLRDQQRNGEALSAADEFQLALLEKDGMTDAKAIGNLANPEMKQDYENWKEGGIYRVGLHVIAGAMGGGVNGAIGAGASSAAAPLLDDMQDKMTQSLIESGMNPATARATASLIAVGTAAAAGGLAGGGIQGATTAANIDLNNRQLHPDEETWLKAKAKEFARREGITEKQAMERLTQQALKEVDYLWRAELADGGDTSAKAFLANTQQTFTNDLGEQQKLFTTSGQQLFRPEMFADTANPAFYKQFAQSGISRSLTTGLAKELRDSGIDLKNGAIDLANALKDNPGAALNAVWNALKGLPQGVVDAFKETGTAIGEGAAVALNEDLQAKLNAIYGTDVSGAQRTILAIRITAAITGASTAAKGAKAGIDASVSAGRKTLDKIESEALEKAAIEKAKINNNFYSEGSAMDFPRELKTSSGVVIRANPDKTTTVLGRFQADTTEILGNMDYVKSTLISGPAAPGSFNLLNVPDNIVAALKPGTFWDTYNKPFLDAAIQRGDDIVVATKPELRFLKRTDGSLSGFGREMQYLESKGFLYDSVTGFMRMRGGQ